jgi:hypothetical protein
MRERGVWVEAGPAAPAPILRGFAGEARFDDIGSATGRAQAGDILINRRDWEQFDRPTKKFVVAHETIHNTVEEYILHDNDEWNIAEDVLTVETIGSGDRARKLYVGGHFQIGESISDSIPMAMFEDWPQNLGPDKREEVGQWARDVTRRSGYGWDVLIKDVNRLVKELDALL